MEKSIDEVRWSEAMAEGNGNVPTPDSPVAYEHHFVIRRNDGSKKILAGPGNDEVTLPREVEFGVFFSNPATYVLTINIIVGRPRRLLIVKPGKKRTLSFIAGPKSRSKRVRAEFVGPNGENLGTQELWVRFKK